MAWRIVKQPNGLLARFSEVVDNFTHLDMTDEEALELCIDEYDMGKRGAAAKIQMGKESPARWEEALGIIHRQHGEREAAVLKDFGDMPPSREKNETFDKVIGLQRL